MKHLFLLPALATLLSGCASIRSAQMDLPPGLQAAPPEPFAGAGFGRSGAFSLAGHRIKFTRSRDRLELLDSAFQRTGGELHLTVDGPDLSTPLQVACKGEERTASLSFFSVEVAPMALRCRFNSDGRAIPARLELQAVRPTGLVSVHERRGEIALDRVILSIRSVHRLAGARIPTDLPIGYEFMRDGRLIGAVEINGTPVLRTTAGLSTEERRALVVGASALGLLWDPSEEA